MNALGPLIAAGGIGLAIGVVLGAVAGMVCTCLIMLRNEYDYEEE